MGMRTLGTIVGLAVAGFVLGLGCSEQDPVQKAGAIVEQEANELADAARTGAAADAVKAAEKSVNKFSDEVQEKGIGKVVEQAADDATIQVRRSGAEAKAAYDEARAKGKSRLESAGNAYDAVDRDNGENDEDEDEDKDEQDDR